MRVIENLKSGIDLTHPKLTVPWMGMFIFFVILVLVLFAIASWFMAQLKTLPGLSTVAQVVAPKESTGPTGAIGGWDY